MFYLCNFFRVTTGKGGALPNLPRGHLTVQNYQTRVVRVRHFPKVVSSSPGVTLRCRNKFGTSQITRVRGCFDARFPRRDEPQTVPGEYLQVQGLSHLTFNPGRELQKINLNFNSRPGAGNLQKQTLEPTHFRWANLPKEKLDRTEVPEQENLFEL